jgi:hypothetical protein
MSFSDKERTYIQKVYPTVNNEDLLEFRIPANVKANLCLSNVLLRFMLKVPQLSGTFIVPENLLGAKQFSSVEIRMNGDAVSRRSCANEYFIGAYFQYITNMAADYACTSCMTFGIFDTYQISTADFTDKEEAMKQIVVPGRKGINDDYVFEIIMPIESSIFSSNKNLPTNTSIDISFERLNNKFSLVTNKAVENIEQMFTLEEPYLLVPFTNDVEMQKLEQLAISRPIKLKFDDYVINRFNISKDSPNVRLSNVLSGPLPSKLFWGLMTLKGYAGSYETSSVHFKRNGLKKTTLYLDGNALSGFPITTAENAVSVPFSRFLENTNRFMNNYSSQTIDPRDFKNYHFIHSAKLPETSGSLSFDLDFDTTPSEEFVLITCSVFDRTVEIDNFRNFRVT